MPAQVLRSQPHIVSVSFPSDPGVVTVTITRLDGTALVTDAATTAADNDRTYTLSAAQTATLDTLSLAFTSGTLGTITETVEVVGALLFTVADARAFDAALTESRFPDAVIEDARARITDEFETICGVSFVPRYRLDTLSGTGYVNLALSRMKVSAIRAVEYRDAGSATWTAYSADDLSDIYIEDYGWILRESRGSFVSGRRNLRVGYEHGFTTPPLDIKRAALIVCRYELLESNATDRTISMSTEFGTTQLSTPNPERNRWYGIPRVDTVLAGHQYTIPVVA